MKSVTLLVALVILLLTTQAQYSLTIKNGSPVAFLDSVRKITGRNYYFNCNEWWLKNAGVVNCSVHNVDLNKLLKAGFRTLRLTYRIRKNGIEVNPRPVEGVLTNKNGDPQPQITIRVKGTDLYTLSDEDGRFKILSQNPISTLELTSVNTDPIEKIITGPEIIYLALNNSVKQLGDVIKNTSTGYQNLPRERTTGSFEVLYDKQVNRNISPFILQGLEGTGNGLLFWKDPYNVNRQRISIRGLSSLFGNSTPLIVIDNWPYEGDPWTANLNPYSVEKVTFLKDAAAASIWGTRAGNGVIVITTKKGNVSTDNAIRINSNISIGSKPNLHYEPTMSTRDYVDIEDSLFWNGFYGLLKNPGRVVSPVIETLVKKQNRWITELEAEKILNDFRTYDNRNDLKKYFYRNPVSQQYAISLNGSSDNQAYFISAGFDKNQNSLKNSGYKRNTFVVNYQLNPKNLQANMSIQYLESETLNKEPAPDMQWNYIPVVDQVGKSQVVPKDIRQYYKDTAAKDIMLDWNYRPYDELLMRNNKTKLYNIRVDAGLQYNFTKNFYAKFLYQYTKDITEQRDYMNPNMYLPRHNFNSYSERSAGGVKRNVPKGGIMDHGDGEFYSKNLRFQTGINPTWGSHEITVMAGAEKRIAQASYFSDRKYGYYPDRPGGIPTDFSTEFPMFYNPSQHKRIESNELKPYNSKDHYGSLFINALYTYNKKYSLSASARQDESNLFGDSSQKNIPLWSAGGAWLISEESFYKIPLLQYLKFRATVGYSGNVIKSVPSVTTIAGGNLNIYNAPANWITTAPNPNLKWEQVKMINVGLDFTGGKKRVDGSIEWYQKISTDLMAPSPLDYTTGNLSYTGNVAEMKGTGVDITLNTRNIVSTKFKWTTKLSASFNRTIITRYPDTADATWKYLDPEFRIPLQGYAPLAVFSLRSRGLDAVNGDPRGFLNGQISKDYEAILTQTPLNELVYNGPEQPVFHGSIYNDFKWKGFNLSFSIIWKLGHYFRNNSISYVDLINGRGFGHVDYEKRWQHPGDEAFTHVPSMKNLNVRRDLFYKLSDVLVEKADNIRLQYVQLGYNFSRQYFKKLPFREARIFIQAANIGILWKATKANTDPDYVSGIPRERTWTIGFSVDFDKIKNEKE